MEKLIQHGGLMRVQPLDIKQSIAGSETVNEEWMKEELMQMKHKYKDLEKH